MLVYIPILALGGIEGKMFKPMAITGARPPGVSSAHPIALSPSWPRSFLGRAGGSRAALRGMAAFGLSRRSGPVLCGTGSLVIASPCSR